MGKPTLFSVGGEFYSHILLALTSALPSAMSLLWQTHRGLCSSL